MKTLDQLALALSPAPDKASAGQDYTRIYDALLSPWRKRAVKLLEIGIWEGASLRMWQAYFARQDAHIVGVDVDLSHYERREGDRFDTLRGDSTDAATMQAIARAHGPFDFIIDDGSHYWQDQRATFGALWGAVKSGGWYAIEDAHTSYTLASPPAVAPSLIEWAKGLADEVNGRGKTRVASLEHATPEERARLTPLELEIASVRFERYLVLIEKRGDSRG